MTFLRAILPVPLTLALLLGACGGGGAGRDTSGPTFFVVATNPPDGTGNVPVTTDVTVLFSKPILPASVHPASIRLGVVGGIGQLAGTTTLVADGDGRTLRWTPSALLEPSSSHLIIVDDMLHSAEGEDVGGDLRFTFVTGSVSGGGDLPPRSALRQSIGWMHLGRRSHTATLTPDGRVLVCGGFIQGTNVTDQAERYDPTTELFTVITERMAQERASHTATMLFDGRILVCGGWYESSVGNLAVTDRAEIYEPATNRFVEVGRMSTPRVDHAAHILPDGRVLVTGGSRLVGSFLEDLDTMEIFDPSTGLFTPVAQRMVHTRATHTMVELGDRRLLMSGGSDVDLRHEVYDPTTGMVTALAPAAQDGVRFGACADVYSSGSALVAGGDALGSVLYVDPHFGVVLNSGSGLSRHRAYATATQIRTDQILVAGGIDLDDGLFIIATVDLVKEGGVSGSQTFETELRFDTGLAFHTATRLLDGRVLFCGGLNAVGGSTELSSAYLFTPPAP